MTSAKKYIARVKRCIPVQRKAHKAWVTAVVKCSSAKPGFKKCVAAAYRLHDKKLGACRGLR